MYTSQYTIHSATELYAKKHLQYSCTMHYPMSKIPIFLTVAWQQTFSCNKSWQLSVFSKYTCSRIQWKSKCSLIFFTFDFSREVCMLRQLKTNNRSAHYGWLQCSHISIKLQDILYISTPMYRRAWIPHANWCNFTVMYLRLILIFFFLISSQETFYLQSFFFKRLLNHSLILTE